MTTGKNKPKPSLIIICQQEKMNPPLPPTVFMTTPKKKKLLNVFIVNVINDCHNNSKVLKEK